MRCSRCHSYAINPTDHGRLPDVDLDLCDVCYWRVRAEVLPRVLDRLAASELRAVEYGDRIVEAGGADMNRGQFLRMNTLVIERVLEHRHGDLRDTRLEPRHGCGSRPSVDPGDDREC